MDGCDGCVYIHSKLQTYMQENERQYRTVVRSIDSEIRLY